MTARLPTSGGDSGNWGDVLNEFLLVAHTPDGRNKVRVTDVAYAATITPNADTTDVANVGALTGNVTVANPTGTPADAQTLRFRFVQDSTGSRTLSWGTAFAFGTDVTAALIPTAANAKWEMLFEWNAADAKWRAVAISRGY